MHYNDSRRFTGAEVLRSDALPPYRAIRDAVIQAAEPFASRLWADSLLSKVVGPGRVERWAAVPRSVT
jgi:hypothetical protein